MAPLGPWVTIAGSGQQLRDLLLGTLFGALAAAGAGELLTDDEAT
jgi:hypothetical protein